MTEAPNPWVLVPQGTVYNVTVVKGSWGQGNAKGYLWMIPVTNDFWDPRHSPLVPTLFVNGIPKATCSYVGQTLPVIWEAPDDPDVEQTTHDRRHVFDPSTIIPAGGTVQIEARVNDPFSPQERAFGLVAWPSMEEEEEEEEEDTSDGDFYCPIPIPNEASHIVEGYEEYWSTPNGFVGPHYTWYDREKTKKRYFKCYNIEGKLHGVCTCWYEDGTPKYESNYKDGKKHGVYKEWYKDGTPEYEKNYKDGKLHGVCKRWYKDGTPRHEWNYKDGKLQGVYKVWYEDGTPRHEWNYKDGKEHGVYKIWYEDGTPRYEYNFKDGKLHGLYKSWYEDGTPQYEGNYKDGKKHGLCKEWWSYNGKLILECNYEEGKCVSCVHGHC